jgi:hypothetical protein
MRWCAEFRWKHRQFVVWHIGVPGTEPDQDLQRPGLWRLGHERDGPASGYPAAAEGHRTGAPGTTYPGLAARALAL